MKLTRHTDYALRLLMALAAKPDSPLTIAAVAKRYRISTEHLRKVAQTLVRGGFVRAVRGRGGGMMLARPAAAIGLGAVVRATEEHFAPVECLVPGTPNCAIVSACLLPGPLRQAVKAFLDVLDRYTLADLLAGPRRTEQLRQLLSLA